MGRIRVVCLPCWAFADEKGAEMRRELFPSDNKHVMLDERGVEYFFHPKRMGWYPGHKERRRFVWTSLPNSRCELRDGRWQFSDGRFYDRPRTYRMLDGTTRRVRVTRYTYREFTKPAPAPKGRNGQCYRMASRVCRRAVYYDGTRFWKDGDIRLGDGTWFNNTLQPFDGCMWDCWENQSGEQGIPVVSIWCDEGVPYRVSMDGDEFDVAPGEWQQLYAQVLCLRGA